MTLRAVAGLAPFRRRDVAAALGALYKRFAREARAMRVVQFTLQTNHIHMLIEADGRQALSRGLISLVTRLALATNRVLGRRGRVFGDRYHARAIASPKSVRHALVYVLQNNRKHGDPNGVDEFSSAAWFGGFRDMVGPPRSDPSPVSPPRTWLLTTGWKRHGLLSVCERPRS